MGRLYVLADLSRPEIINLDMSNILNKNWELGNEENWGDLSSKK